MKVDRRRFLSQAASLCALPILSRFLPACAAARSSASTQPSVTFEPPQRLTTSVAQNPSGVWERSFSGVAAPQNLELWDSTTQSRRSLFDMFPSQHDPFAINAQAELGPGGYALRTVDRASTGDAPAADVQKRPLCMIPFGVALDGALIDPSGPWYDGGTPDPQNPFDRKCSGWEYDPVFASVGELVGVPPDVRGHVQPGAGGQKGSRGQFHYHGVPRVMLANLRAALSDAEKTTALVVGYSADGFLIIDDTVPAVATSTGKRLHLFSGYVLRSGSRTAVPHTNPALVPAGDHDGTFVQDWVHDPSAKRALIEAALANDGQYLGLSASDRTSGAADYALLDDRNGMSSKGLALPGVARDTYVYVLTQDWPEVPRWFALAPSDSFKAVIPFASSAMGPPGRQQLYDACPASLADVHQWDGLAPY
jgi:hypothetical protein